jgi:trimeric autotransporter adhesin
MYDVNFGGNEFMTKRLNIALVAVALLLVLVTVMPVSAATYTVRTGINQGATVFFGESGLNLTMGQYATYVASTAASAGPVGADQDAAIIGWWASAADIQTTSPTKTIDLKVGSQNQSFLVPSADGGLGAVGNWYLVNQGNNKADTPAFFSMADPTLNIYVWDFGNAVQRNDVDVTGKTVPQGEWLGFKITTNQIDALGAKRWSYNLTATSSPSDPMWAQWNNKSEGYIDITVKDANGATLTALLNKSTSGGGFYNSLLKQNVSNQAPWIWGSAPSTWNTQFLTTGLDTVKYANWSTEATDSNGQYAYPPGTYTIYATSKLNGMNDNYKLGGADYTLKVVSPTVTVNLASDSVKIEANKDSVVRSKAFSVTITGRPNTVYHVWVKGTSTLTGGYDSQPPMVKASQDKIVQDYNSGSATVAPYAANSLSAGAYQYENGAGSTIWNDVTKAASTMYGTAVYCNATTSSTTATRTIEFTTTNWTKAQKYTIRVEQRFPIAFAADTQCSGVVGAANYCAASYVKSDEVDVKVEKGAVTIVAAGDQSYYLGEEIKFSGTNTETYKTYLFIIGPNLPQYGAQISSTNPRDNAITDLVDTTFKIVDVQGDNTWSWKWGTSTVALDAGTYTIYAVSQPRDNQGTHLANAAYGTVSIIIKKPFVSATASQSTVAQGDKLFITGTAEGSPVAVKIWVLGKNYPTNADGVKTESVNSDASFKYEVTQGTTRTMYPGQYFVVVQHPMQNNVFDIDMCTGTVSSAGADLTGKVCNRQAIGGMMNGTVFTLLGASSLQGSDAAEALVQGINSPNVDDTYTKLQFLVEVPVIRIDPIGDKRVGDKFTITAQTNLAVDDEILVQVYSSSFKPTQKSQSGEFSGATGTVKVAKGDSGMNKISFDVDSSTFKPDEYIVQESAVIQTATGTALFNVLEGTVPTATPVVVVTTVVSTPVPTPVVTTAAPTPVPTTKSPGYGALIALIGLGAVAFIVVRRH